MPGGYYEPFRPQLTDNDAVNLAAAILANQFGQTGGAGLIPPGGYSNTAQLMSRMGRDRIHQEMMSATAYQNRDRIGAQFVGAANMVMNPLGKQIDPSRQAAIADFSSSMMANAGGLFASGPMGRAALDAAAGGNSLFNLSSGLTLSYKRMRSPLTMRPQLGVSELTGMTAGLDEYFQAGGDILERSRRSAGFRYGDMAEIIDYNARRGQLASAISVRGVIESPGMAEAIRSGTITPEMLSKMGMAGAEEFVDADMADPEIQRKLSSLSGRMAGASITSTSRSIAAIRELFEQDGIVPQTAELLETLDKFSSQYSYQLSGARIEQTIRQTSVAMKEFGWGVNEVAQFQQESANLAQQMGLSSAYGVNLAEDATASVRAANLAGSFSRPVYGGMSPDQMLRSEQLAAGRYVKSQAGNITAVLARLGDSGDFANNEEGQRLRKIYSEMMSGGEITDSAFLDMSGEQQMQLLSRGMIGTSIADIRNMRNQGFQNEERLSRLPNAAALRMQQQTREARRQMQREMSRVAGAIGLQPGQGRLLEVITGTTLESFGNMSSAMVDSDELNPYLRPDNAKAGADVYDKLKALADSGDKEAAAYLASLGSTEEEQKRKLTLYADKQLDQLGARGSRSNIHKSISAEQQNNKLRTTAEIRIKSGVEALLAANSNATVSDALINFGSILRTEGGGDVVEGMGALTKAMSSEKGDSAARIAAIETVLQEQLAAYEAVISDDTQSDGTRAAATRNRDALKSYYENEWKSVKNATGAAAAEDPVAAAAGKAKSPEEFIAMLAEKGIRMDGVTININGETVLENGRATTDSRGTPNTAAQ